MERLKGYALVAIGIVIGSLISGMTVMVSAHGGNTTLIHACLNPGNGTIYVVGPNEACGPNQLALDWNIQGPQGPAGPQGPEGPEGPGGFRGTYLRGASLAEADLRYRNLSGFDLLNADLTGADLTGADLTRAYMIGANLTGAGLTYTVLRFANLTGAYLTGADLFGANLSNTGLQSAHLTNTNLTGAQYDAGSPPDVGGVIYDNTTCPDGSNSNANGGTCSGHGMP